MLLIQDVYPFQHDTCRVVGSLQKSHLICFYTSSRRPAITFLPSTTAGSYAAWQPPRSRTEDSKPLAACGCTDELAAVRRTPLVFDKISKEGGHVDLERGSIYFLPDPASKMIEWHNRPMNHLCIQVLCGIVQPLCKSQNDCRVLQGHYDQTSSHTLGIQSYTFSDGDWRHRDVGARRVQSYLLKKYDWIPRDMDLHRSISHTETDPCQCGHE